MKVVLNIEKRFAYVIIGLLIILVGIVAVNAFTSPTQSGNPAVMGHGASEVAPGTFGGDANSIYSFPGSVNILNSVDISKILSLGKVGAGTQQGIIILNSGAANKNLIRLDNAYGDLRITDPSWNAILSVSQNGNINMKSGAKITSSQYCIGASCITSWPTAPSAQCVFCASSKSSTDPLCGDNWPIFTGQVDGGNHNQVTLDVNCLSYTSGISSIINGQTYYFQEQGGRANLCCR